MMTVFPARPGLILGGIEITHVEILDPDRPHAIPDERGCPDCGEGAYFSGCDTDGCNGYACPDCGTGCDLDFVDDGRCAAAQDDDDDEDEEDC